MSCDVVRRTPLRIPCSHGFSRLNIIFSATKSSTPLRAYVYIVDHHRDGAHTWYARIYEVLERLCYNVHTVVRDKQIRIVSGDSDFLEPIEK